MGLSSLEAKLLSEIIQKGVIAVTEEYARAVLILFGKV